MTRSRIIDICLTLIYKGLLDVVLVFFVLPLYNDDPIFHIFGRLNSIKVSIGYAIAVACLMSFSGMGECRRVSRFVLATQFVFILVPFLSIFGCVDLPVWYPAVMAIGFLTTVLVARLGKVWRMPRLSSYFRYIAWCVLASIVVTVFTLLIAGGGLGRFNLDLNKVYDARDAYKNQVAPWIFQFVSWVGYVLDMVVIVLAVRPLNGRWRIMRWSGVVLMVLVQVALFGMTSFKAFLLLPFVIIGLLALGNKVNVVKALMLGAPLLALTFLILALSHNPMGGVLLERTFFIPAGMHSLYLDYFSSHSHLYFTGHFLGELLGGSPGQTAVNRIAIVYWGRSFSPNVGWIGIAFASWGVIGVIAEAVVLGGILRVGDGLARDAIPRGAAEGLLLGPTIALASAGLSDTMFSAGFGLALFVLWLLEAHYAGGIRMVGPSRGATNVS